MGYTGDRIREERKLQRIKAGDLAKRSGITPSTLWRIESGAVDPQAETLAQIAKALKIDKKQLVPPPSITKSMTKIYPAREELLATAWRLLQKLDASDLDAIVSLAERLATLHRQRDITISMAWASIGEDEPEQPKAQKRRKK